MHGKGESNSRPEWPLTHVLLTAGNGLLTLRDVKNGATSGDVYENTGDRIKCTPKSSAFYTKMPQWRGNRHSRGLFGPKC